MTEADPLSDLDLRRQQLEAHLLQSHDYRGKAGGRLKLLSVIFGLALVLMLGEGVVYERESHPASPLVLGSIEVTSIVLTISVLLFFQARRGLRRLNERWLTTDAKKALVTLRQEQARRRDEVSE